ncbi:hypothetical protein C0J52_25020 [Blattella germanica]|nr:hypothetical protein C0J52_25020 [Blattella germanica]
MTISSMELVLVAFILILPFLYETSRAFRYYFKFFVYYGIVMTIAVVVIPIMICRPKDVKNLLLASAICRHISGLVGLKWELRGQEYLEKEQACIIVANHQSSLDILGMFDIWPIMDKCTVVAKKELFYAWPFGLAAWLCGNIIITTLPPIKTEGLSKGDVEDLMNRTRSIMLEAFTVTTKEVQAAARMRIPSY